MRYIFARKNVGKTGLIDIIELKSNVHIVDENFMLPKQNLNIKNDFIVQTNVGKKIEVKLKESVNTVGRNFT